MRLFASLIFSFLPAVLSYAYPADITISVGETEITVPIPPGLSERNSGPGSLKFSEFGNSRVRLHLVGSIGTGSDVIMKNFTFLTSDENTQKKVTQKEYEQLKNELRLSARKDFIRGATFFSHYFPAADISYGKGGAFFESEDAVAFLIPDGQNHYGTPVPFFTVIISARIREMPVNAAFVMAGEPLKQEHVAAVKQAAMGWLRDFQAANQDREPEAAAEWSGAKILSAMYEGKLLRIPMPEPFSAAQSSGDRKAHDRITFKPANTSLIGNNFYTVSLIDFDLGGGKTCLLEVFSTEFAEILDSPERLRGYIEFRARNSPGTIRDPLAPPEAVAFAANACGPCSGEDALHVSDIVRVRNFEETPERISRIFFRVKDEILSLRIRSPRQDDSRSLLTEWRDAIQAASAD